MVQEFTSFSLTDKEKAKMTTRELINYLKAKKVWIDNRYANKGLSANKGNKEQVSSYQKLITRVFSNKTPRTFGDIAKNR